MKKIKTQWHEAFSSAFSFPFLTKISQNRFVFDVVTFEKVQEFLQNCFNFDLVEFTTSGSLAELLRFLMWLISKFEDVSQNSFVFKLASRQIDRIDR